MLFRSFYFSIQYTIQSFAHVYTYTAFTTLLYHGHTITKSRNTLWCSTGCSAVLLVFESITSINPTQNVMRRRYKHPAKNTLSCCLQWFFFFFWFAILLLLVVVCQWYHARYFEMNVTAIWVMNDDHHAYICLTFVPFKYWHYSIWISYDLTPT